MRLGGYAGWHLALWSTASLSKGFEPSEVKFNIVKILTLVKYFGEKEADLTLREEKVHRREAGLSTFAECSKILEANSYRE
jgi:hypothetical protein